MPIELAQNAETWQGQKYQKNHIHMCVVIGLVQWRNNMSHLHSDLSRSVDRTFTGNLTRFPDEGKM